MTFIYHDKGHSYELDGKKMTGVTTILGVIAKPSLIGWAARMTAEYIEQNSRTVEDFLRNIGVIGKNNLPAGKVALSVPQMMKDALIFPREALEQAVKAHTKKKEEGGEKGKDLHSEVEEYIKKCIELGHLVVVGPEDGSVCLEKFATWAHDNDVRFLASEQPLYSEEWFVAGTPDFIFEKDGKVFVGDLKSYKKIWDKVPAYQCAAYAKMWTEMGNRPVDGTCIVNINKETGELTDQWFYDLKSDVECFEAALKLYRSLQNF